MDTGFSQSVAATVYSMYSMLTIMLFKFQESVLLVLIHSLFIEIKLCGSCFCESCSSQHWNFLGDIIITSQPAKCDEWDKWTSTSGCWWWVDILLSCSCLLKGYSACGVSRLHKFYCTDISSSKVFSYKVLCGSADFSLRCHGQTFLVWLHWEKKLWMFRPMLCAVFISGNNFASLRLEVQHKCDQEDTDL